MRKLEVVHKQVGGHMRKLYTRKWEIIIYPSTCMCEEVGGYLTRYVGIDLLVQVKTTLYTDRTRLFPFYLQFSLLGCNFLSLNPAAEIAKGTDEEGKLQMLFARSDRK